jgi:hypothetical protein
VATLIQYVAWLLAGVGSVLDMLAIREAVLALLAWYRVIETKAYRAAGGVGEDIFTGFGISAADNVILVILACGAVAVTVWAEYYFRKGRPKGELYKRIGKVLGIELAVIVVAMIIRVIVSGILQNTP